MCSSDLGGIGGTYAVMPELFLKIYELFQRGENQKARQIQNEVCRIIYKMCSTGANLYGVMKELLRRSGIDVGSVRRPLRGVGAEDMLAVCEASGPLAYRQLDTVFRASGRTWGRNGFRL